jgi:hypothetical protein
MRRLSLIVAAGVSPAVEGRHLAARKSAGQDARLYGRPEARRYGS